MENSRYSLKMAILRPLNIFSKRNFYVGLGISFVGTINLSSYMQSEQPKVAGKHLMRLANNGMAIVTCMGSNPASRASRVFIKG